MAALMEYETIDSDQINDIMAGVTVRPPKPSQSKSNPPRDSGSSDIDSSTVPQPSAKV